MCTQCRKVRERERKRESERGVGGRSIEQVAARRAPWFASGGESNDTRPIERLASAQLRGIISRLMHQCGGTRIGVVAAIVADRAPSLRRKYLRLDGNISQILIIHENVSTRSDEVIVLAKPLEDDERSTNDWGEHANLHSFSR